eukprot:CAMPEP_0181311732 /NCGR_PEP_ID=MMETSP1101-20121128/13306_1 /TAXON_ID=46948 /ORGANISM="Rhodomonas abbreviata, Strain Caron Lab Isolate" /LENGTH=46 /DNA_ID= /DNA_START= /DNA_END= /DNA_ORIENTATION=
MHAQLANLARLRVRAQHTVAAHARVIMRNDEVPLVQAASAGNMRRV